MLTSPFHCQTKSLVHTRRQHMPVMAIHSLDYCAATLAQTETHTPISYSHSTHSLTCPPNFQNRRRRVEDGVSARISSGKTLHALICLPSPETEQNYHRQISQTKPETHQMFDTTITAAMILISSSLAVWMRADTNRTECDALTCAWGTKSGISSWVFFLLELLASWKFWSAAHPPTYIRWRNEYQCFHRVEGFTANLSGILKQYTSPLSNYVTGP